MDITWTGPNSQARFPTLTSQADVTAGTYHNGDGQNSDPPPAISPVPQLKKCATTHF